MNIMCIKKHVVLPLVIDSAAPIDVKIKVAKFYILQFIYFAKLNWS